MMLLSAGQLKTDIISPQRPSASELLKHRFVRNAKRPQYLTELIERHENFKSQGPSKAPVLPSDAIQT